MPLEDIPLKSYCHWNVRTGWALFDMANNVFCLPAKMARTNCVKDPLRVNRNWTGNPSRLGFPATPRARTGCLRRCLALVGGLPMTPSRPVLPSKQALRSNDESTLLRPGPPTRMERTQLALKYGLRRMWQSLGSSAHPLRPPTQPSVPDPSSLPSLPSPTS